MKVALLGGTRGMGRALAQELARRGEEVFLLGRDAADLGRSVADLQHRGGGRQRLGHATCDLNDPESFGPALGQAREFLGGLDTVIVTAGIFATQEQLEEDPRLTAEMLRVNFSNTILFCEEVRRLLLEGGGGTLCVFSSVAGDRGRKPVVLYGSTKAGLSRYLEGLDHRFRERGLVTICVKPGFVRTGMTEGLKPPPFAGEPEQVARHVLRAIDRGTPMIYTPPVWRPILWIIRCLPRAVMRRIGF